MVEVMRFEKGFWDSVSWFVDGLNKRIKGKNNKGDCWVWGCIIRMVIEVLIKMGKIGEL